MNRFCPSCGRPIESNVRFCTSCGARVDEASPMGAPQPQSPPAFPSPAPAPAAPAQAATQPRTLPSTPVQPPDKPPRRPYRWLKFVLIALGIVIAAFAGLIALGLLLEDSLNPPAGAGWTLKDGEGQSLYAVVAPSSATLNVKAVVLACEVVSGGRGLHFQLYPATPGPLLPNGATREQLKDDPSVRLEIDGEISAAQLDFAGDFAVVYNQVAGGLPTMTPALGNALERGNKLTLRFDLVRDQAGTQPFDAYAVVDLKSAKGASSIAAVRRRCGQ